MRINKIIAQSTGLSRRAVDQLIKSGQVTVNNVTAELGQLIEPSDMIKIDQRVLEAKLPETTIIFNKPVGYICSREAQGGKSIYELLPPEFSHLKTAGRLDKDSSGLLVLTNDGDLANQLTHPSFNKIKTYRVKLDRPLSPDDRQTIDTGLVTIDDRPSLMKLKPTNSDQIIWEVKMSEGRNRQIRRTFAALNYEVVELIRLSVGDYHLDDLAQRKYKIVS